MELRKFIIAIVTKFNAKGSREATRALKTLKSEARGTGRATDDLADSTDKASRSGKKFSRSTDDAARSSKKFGRAQRDANGRLRNARGKFVGGTSGAKGFSGAIQGLSGNLSGLGGVLATATAGLAALATTGALIAREVITTGSAFEGLQARLDNLLGSEALGADAFAFIQDFTTSTPFQLEAVTTAFTKLQGRGIAPTEERLTALGDLASSSGKSLDDITEAVLDATQGEGERLKEFGIRMKKNGDQVSLSFKGITKEVALNEEAIAGVLTGFGQVEGVAGTMASQMATTGGRISNLKDSFALMFNEVANLGVLDEFNLLLSDVAGVAGEDGLAQTLADVLVDALRALRLALADVTSEDMATWLNGISVAGDIVATAITFAGIAIKQLLDFAKAVQLLAKDFEGLGESVETMTPAIKALTGSMGFLVSTTEKLAGAWFKVFEAIAETLGIGKEFKAFMSTLGPSAGRARATGERAARQVSGASAFLGGGKDLLDRGAAVERARKSGDTAELDRIAGSKTFSGEDNVFAAQAADSQRREQQDAEARERFGKQVEREQFEAALAGEEEEEEEEKPPKRGRKGSKFFDFEKKAGREARKRGEAFSATELERLSGEGVEFEAALAQSRDAGKARSAELREQFLRAGKILDEDSKNFLDVLGLKGPGSEMAKRPAPNTLIVNINPIIKFAEQITVIVEGAGAATLAEATSAAGQGIVENALSEGALAQAAALFKMMFNLEGDALLAAGTGQLPEGPSG